MNLLDEKNALSKLVSDLSFEQTNAKFEYVYRGVFTSKTTNDLLTIVELGLENADYKKSLKKKLLFVMVETMQNIMKHQEIDFNIHDERNNLFSLVFESSHFAVTTANIIKKTTKPKLKQLLERVNSCPVEELKVLYQNTLVDGEISDKGGAGLGFIAMARKTDHHLAYDFIDIDNTHAIFYLKAFIKIDPEFRGKLSTDSEKALHQLLINYNLQSCLRGFFTPTNTNLVKIDFDTRFQRIKQSSLRQKLMKISYAMLDNLVKYAATLESGSGGTGVSGLYAVQRKGRNINVYSANCIENSKKQLLAEKITYVNQLSKTEIVQIQSAIEQNEFVQIANKPDENILQIKNLSVGPIIYDFIQNSKHMSTFAQKVEISLTS